MSLRFGGHHNGVRADSGVTWRAALSVSTHPDHIAALGYDEFAAAVTEVLPRWGGKRRHHRILHAIHAAAQAPSGVEAERDAACERAADLLRDWHHALGEIAGVEAHMLAVLDALHLTRLVSTITGLSAVGAAAILAQTGDPARYDSPRTWVKHAGLCPRANESGTFQGTTKVSGRGRPPLRTAAWRAIWGALSHNPVYTARYRHLTTRANNPLRPAQAPGMNRTGRPSARTTSTPRY